MAGRKTIQETGSRQNPGRQVAAETPETHRMVRTHPDLQQSRVVSRTGGRV